LFKENQKPLNKQRGSDTKRQTAIQIRELEKTKVKYYIQRPIRSHILQHLFIKTEAQLCVGYIKPSSGCE